MKNKKLNIFVLSALLFGSGGTTATKLKTSDADNSFLSQIISISDKKQKDQNSGLNDIGAMNAGFVEAQSDEEAY